MLYIFYHPSLHVSKCEITNVLQRKEKKSTRIYNTFLHIPFNSLTGITPSKGEFV